MVSFLFVCLRDAVTEALNWRQNQKDISCLIVRLSHGLSVKLEVDTAVIGERPLGLESYCVALTAPHMPR